MLVVEREVVRKKNRVLGKKLGFGGFGKKRGFNGLMPVVRVRCSPSFGSSTHARDPPRSTRFICSQVRRLPEETIRETRDRLPESMASAPGLSQNLRLSTSRNCCLGMAPEKQVDCLLVPVDLDRPLVFLVQMHPRRPRVVAVRAHVIAVEQRVIVDTMAPAGPFTRTPASQFQITLWCTMKFRQ